MTDETPKKFDTVSAPISEMPQRAARRAKPRRNARPRPKPPSPALVKTIADRAARPQKPIMKMKAAPNWDDDTEYMVADEGVDRLKIPREIVEALDADGIALQWVTHSVRGMEMPLELAKMTKGGWTPVHQSDFDGVLDGIFMPKGLDEVVRVDDCMLVARPKSINTKARQRERQLAREPLQIKEAAFKGHGVPVSGGDHPSALSQNRMNKTMERIEIPE